MKYKESRGLQSAGDSKAPPFIGGEESSAGMNPAALELGR
jgi:hypothetical protein